VLPIGDINPARRAPVVTVLVILACIAIYFGFQISRDATIVQTELGAVQLPASDAFTLHWAAVPCEVTSAEPLSVREVARTFNGGDTTACDRGRHDDPLFYRDKHVYGALLVSMFMHGGLAHLGLNMLFLWIFGNNVEDRLGSLGYALFYLVGGVAATAAHVVVQPSSTVPLIGASGAIAAVMGAYLVWFPNAPIRTLVLLFIPVTVRAMWFLGLWFVLQFFTDTGSGVAWVAHVGGFVFGVVAGLLIGRPEPPVSMHGAYPPYEPYR
jgi:membrane associated rhomboid family serine protease